MCARGRLFKPTSSFGYRRLLPYLMDVAKEDDSGNFTALRYPCCFLPSKLPDLSSIHDTRLNCLINSWSQALLEHARTKNPKRAWKKICCNRYLN